MTARPVIASSTNSGSFVTNTLLSIQSNFALLLAATAFIWNGATSAEWPVVSLYVILT